MSTGQWVKLVTIPFFTGTIGWLINWTGLLMLFNPVRFHGFGIPGLQELSTLLPRKLQEVPGIMQGGVGWQGIVPPGGEDGQHRGRQGDREARHAGGVLPAARA
jgi:hypothetical protein